MSNRKVDPRVRKETILAAASTLATLAGNLSVSREAVANATGLGEGTISLHFSTMHQLRKEVVRRALANRDVPVLALATGSDKYRVPLPEDLKALVLSHIGETV